MLALTWPLLCKEALVLPYMPSLNMCHYLQPGWHHQKLKKRTAMLVPPGVTLLTREPWVQPGSQWRNWKTVLKKNLFAQTPDAKNRDYPVCHFCHSACKTLMSWRGRKMAEWVCCLTCFRSRASLCFWHLQASAAILCVAIQLPFKLQGERISLA